MNHGLKTVSLPEAQGIILDAVTPLGPESISIFRAVKRLLHQDIVADAMIPPLESSARDGYAVLARGTAGAAPDKPVRLEIVGEIQAGGSPQGLAVTPGKAVRIMTGAPLPTGADAVVQFEDTREADGWVELLREAAPFENYRQRGENIKTGEKVLLKGDRLNAADVGILASLNHETVRVYRRPRVAIISTGDELAAVGEELEFGKVRDVNAYALCAEARKCNAEPEHLGIARDSLPQVRELLGRALEADVILSTGGGSMGKYDFVKDAYADLGVEMRFGRVRVKPGKPCSFGTMGGKLFFSLPGNPVSALTCFIEFVRPALLALMGARKLYKPVVSAVLDEAIGKKPSKNLRLLRGRFSLRDGEFHVATTGDQKSSIFKSLRDANCLIIIPANSGRMPAGQKVRVQLIAHEEIEGPAGF
ncbi:MAG: molybdopterin molybdotransferase MoeA [Desulfarculaceae bacterium]|nr:molybdopterin molybdotransferase MoeA [Desulfarculaceae bacterium]MCF8074322.1 molybdopterin molybdotransferase MoeA [Desulfarculaceae bacterium]MCF8103390.1 molybdopterin molybdotransferase MoeA [Desulfarculaceae bacterium]MCF8117755.1 molybdopterin molybdotransferase MoeA [Desulfarculaceae bacterium]